MLSNPSSLFDFVVTQEDSIWTKFKRYLAALSIAVSVPFI